MGAISYHCIHMKENLVTGVAADRLTKTPSHQSRNCAKIARYMWMLMQLVISSDDMRDC